MGLSLVLGVCINQLRCIFFILSLLSCHPQRVSSAIQVYRSLSSPSNQLHASDVTSHAYTKPAPGRDAAATQPLFSTRLAAVWAVPVCVESNRHASSEGQSCHYKYTAAAETQPDNAVEPVTCSVTVKWGQHNDNVTQNPGVYASVKSNLSFLYRQLCFCLYSYMLLI